MMKKNGTRNKSIQFAAVAMTMVLLGSLIGCSAAPDSKMESLPGTEDSVEATTEFVTVGTTENVTEALTESLPGIGNTAEVSAVVSTKDVAAGTTEKAAEASTENVAAGTTAAAADSSETYEQIIDIMDKSYLNLLLLRVLNFHQLVLCLIFQINLF